MTDETPHSEDAITITVDLSAMTISDMRALTRVGASMSTDEAMVIIPQVFDTLHRVGLGSLPLDQLSFAVSQIWATLGKQNQASTTP
jgi:hypothetical protein